MIWIVDVNIWRIYYRNHWYFQPLVGVTVFSNIFFYVQIKTASKDSIETLSALEIAEQMTYLDHQIFMNIRSEWVSNVL